MRTFSKNQKILFIIVLLFIFIFSSSLTYAFFSAGIDGNEDATEQLVTTGTLSIVYTDSPEINYSDIEPGWSVTKTLTVSNTGTLDASYSLVWQNLTNEIVNNELVYSSTCTSQQGYVCNSGFLDTAVPSTGTNVPVLTDRVIKPNDTHTLTLTFNFIEISSAQNYNQSKSFYGKFALIEGQGSVTEGQIYERTIHLGDSRVVAYNSYSLLNPATEYAIGTVGIRESEISNHLTQLDTYLDDNEGTSFNITLGYGVNDYLGASSLANYQNAYDNIITTYGENHHIFIISILPVNDDVSNWAKNATINEFNNSMKTYYEDNDNVTYCDVTGSLSTEDWQQYIDSSGIHFTNAGYNYILSQIHSCINANPVSPETSTPPASTAYEKNIFMGDGRTERMINYGLLNSKTDHSIVSTAVMLSDFTGTHVPALNTYLSQHSTENHNIILAYGLNDNYAYTTDASPWFNAIDSLVTSTYPQQHVFVISTLPVNDDISLYVTNSNIEAFNSLMSAHYAADSRVTYCDIYSTLTNTQWNNYIDTNGGINYTLAGEQYILSKIRECVEGA